VSPEDQTRVRCNLEFHTAVSSATHNRILQDLLERLSTHMIHTPRSTLSVGRRWEDSLDKHVAMVQAIAEQRFDDARGIARTHMETARSLWLELLRNAAKAEWV
jgi:DNA-binding FadR family transcriptional regulator